MNADQIAADRTTGFLGYPRHQDPETWDALYETIQSAIEKAKHEGYLEGHKAASDFARTVQEERNEQSRAAQGNETQPESDFIMANHHPSCTINDQDLMWVCSQCGLKVSAESRAAQAGDSL